MEGHQMDRLVAMAEADPDRRARSVKETIDSARDSFIKAIQNLDLADDSNRDPERSVLDCAVHIATMCLELCLYERILTGKGAPIKPAEAHQVAEGQW